MERSSRGGWIGIATGARRPLFLFGLVVLVMGNLSAWVDAVLHPEIPYLDQEHLIVGGTTALVSAVLFGGLIVYIRRLGRALQTIESLEAIIPICSYCKNILRDDGNPTEMQSWQPIEAYVSEKTKSQLTHGICPACLARHYPESVRQRGAEGKGSPARGQGPDDRN